MKCSYCNKLVDESELTEVDRNVFQCEDCWKIVGGEEL